jgi:Baculovirus occlusion-derived virus envelope protein EC27
VVSVITNAAVSAAAMKRFKCHNNNKVRTVTEIINGDEKYVKEYDLAEFDAKNLNSLESHETLTNKMVLANYMAMLNTLNLTQPLVALFRDKNAVQEINTVVCASLGFVHNRVNPLVNHFNSLMSFVITENRDTIIPGEPLFFRQHENGDVVCLIDRLSILRTLDREFDLDINVNSLHRDRDRIQLAKAFRCRDKHSNLSSPYPSRWDIRLTETDATQYLALLMIHEHAYIHYFHMISFGLLEYSRSLSDHSMFANKSRPSFNSKFYNLMMPKCKFTIEDGDTGAAAATNDLAIAGGSKNFGLLSYA